MYYGSTRRMEDRDVLVEYGKLRYYGRGLLVQERGTETRQDREKKERNGCIDGSDARHKADTGSENNWRLRRR